MSKYGHLFYDKGETTVQWRKEGFFSIYCTGLNGYPHGIKRVLTTTSCHIQKIKSERLDINVKGKKESVLEKNGTASYEHGVGKDPQKAFDKMDQLDYITI